MNKTLFVMAAGRKRRVFQKIKGGNFQIRIRVNGLDKPLSLGTTIEHIAKQKAIAQFERAVNGDVEELERNMDRPAYCTVEQILEHYAPRPDQVSADTVRKNKSQMRLLVREGAGVHPAIATAAVFIGDAMIKTFQKKRMLAVKSADFVKRDRQSYCTDRVVAQARSILAPKYADLYQGLKLPDLTAFRKAPLLNVRRDFSFVPFPPGVIERIDAELPQQLRNVQITALLMRYACFRNSEVEFAMWEWFQLQPDGSAIVDIKLRPYFRPKNYAARTLILDAQLVDKLRSFWGEPNEWIIDAPHATGRFDATHSEINAWIRPILPGRTKCSYELRKYAGSVILTRPESEGGGLAAAAKALGDTIQTTEKHYGTYLKSVHAVRSGESQHEKPLVKAA